MTRAEPSQLEGTVVRATFSRTNGGYIVINRPQAWSMTQPLLPYDAAPPPSLEPHTVKVRGSRFCTVQ